MSFLLFLMFSFHKIGEEDRTGSAWKQEGREKEGAEGGGRDGPNNVYTYE
jgi:hypothetical protein